MKINFDGGASPNPGFMHIAVVIDGEETVFRQLGYGTNNIAEWSALMLAIEIAEERGAREVTLAGDSQLVVRQANGRYQVKKPELIPFKAEFDLRKARFAQVTVVEVPRSQNVAGWKIEAMLKSRRFPR